MSDILKLLFKSKNEEKNFRSETHNRQVYTESISSITDA